VDALDLDVEDRVGIDLDVLSAREPSRQVDLVGMLDGAQFLEIALVGLVGL
jgi:hypothetical protein